ncbi:hypothetical protein Taro_021066, partial [Colocasia esculenta]|nr:hypothetical protein [Colocasia esculenta]
GPYVRDCETERLFLCCVVRCVLVVVLRVEVCHGVGTVVVEWWYLVVVGRVLNTSVAGVAFRLPLFGVDACMRAACRAQGGAADVWSGLAEQSFPKLCSTKEGAVAALIGRFGVLARFSTRSQREDVARSGGNATPCLDCVFFVKCVLVVVLRVEVCHGVGTVVVEWWYLVVVVRPTGVEVLLYCVLFWVVPFRASDLLRLTPLQSFSGFTIGVACGGVVSDLYHQQ